MSNNRAANPFDDMLDPPSSASQPKAQRDPFADEDDIFDSHPQGQSGSKGGQHGYAMDPFFDEYVCCRRRTPANNVATTTTDQRLHHLSWATSLQAILLLKFQLLVGMVEEDQVWKPTFP